MRSISTSSSTPRPPSPVISPAGFSTMTADRPFLMPKSVSETNLTAGSSGDATSDLNREVAALSNKLINAINHQTQLDDSLVSTKHELEMSKLRIQQLEADAKEHADMMAKGLLVEKKDVENETQKLVDKLKEESRQRGKAEKDKKSIEQELESLTTALFDEANKMVSAARRERDAVDRKNAQLLAQLQDTESLLSSHQEQLAELKLVLAQATVGSLSDADLCVASPSTTLGHRQSKASLGKFFESLNLAPNTNPEDMPPVPPTNLTALLHPVLRTDTTAYQEFVEVVRAPKPKSTIPRLSSGSFSSMSLSGIASLASSNPSLSPSHSPSTSLSGIFGGRKDSDAFSSANPSPNNTPAPNAQPPGHGLKETKFFKRVLIEDIEPTLRLDCAPGLSWLARRNVLAAITDGNLVIDPIAKVAMACAMCGESRADEKHERAYRMRTNEASNAPKYPLCAYCVGRIRSVCDFVAFLRAWKEGLWKVEKETDEEAAWEEGVRLRERMFWARIGGGVIPAFFRTDISNGNSRDVGEKKNLVVEQKLDDKVKSDKEIRTPPKTPTMKPSFRDESYSDGTRLEVPKKRLSRGDPFLTPERQVVREKDVMLGSPPRRSDDSMVRSEDERSINDTGSVIRHIIRSGDDSDSISRVTLTGPNALSELDIGTRDEEDKSELGVRDEEDKSEILAQIEQSSLPPLPPSP